ncbi:DUF2490 domain-containing protein [Algoriphagus jejuensis]
MKKLIALFLLLSCSPMAWGQASFDEDQLGAWYMYFFTHRFGDSPWGVQGDFQYRSWDLGGDKEQLLLRSGLTYTPNNTSVTFTLGYANVSSGAFGDGGEVVLENRIYQEALIPQKVGGRFLLTHRFRYEQRWVEYQDFRTRYRYNLFVNVPLNAKELKKNTLYVALYNEIFINGQKDIGRDVSVEFFDRNRTYLGMGYGLGDRLRTQLGWMRQTTNNWAKNQLQVSLHHAW